MPDEIDNIVASLMQDPDFSPEEGRTKEESAHAVANSRVNTMKKANAALSLAKMFPNWTEDLLNLRKAPPGAPGRPTGTNPYKRPHSKGSGLGAHNYPASRRSPASKQSTPKGPPPFPGAQWNPITHQWHKPNMVDYARQGPSATDQAPQGTPNPQVAGYNPQGQNPSQYPPQVQNDEPVTGSNIAGLVGAPSRATGGGFGGEDNFMALGALEHDQLNDIIDSINDQVKYWDKQGYKDISNMYKAKLFEVEEELDRRAESERGRMTKDFSWRSLLGSKDKEDK
jgi:hypothetical protein|tara:strand:- start:3750 stop:4598 length:849 start_codon:yes stop_codon:yes gene_type:complete